MINGISPQTYRVLYHAGRLHRLLSFSNVVCKHRRHLSRQPFLRRSRNSTLQPHIRCTKELTDPDFDVRNIWPLVSRGTFDRSQLSETHAKAHVVRVLFCYGIVCCCWDRWIL